MVIIRDEREKDICPFCELKVGDTFINQQSARLYMVINEQTEPANAVDLLDGITNYFAPKDSVIKVDIKITIKRSGLLNS